MRKRGMWVIFKILGIGALIAVTGIVTVILTTFLVVAIREFPKKEEKNVNSCKFTGRLTKDPEIRYGHLKKPICIACFQLAVNNPGGGVAHLDMIATGKRGEFVEKYLKEGERIGVHCIAVSVSCEESSYTEFAVERFFYAGKGEMNENC